MISTLYGCFSQKISQDNYNDLSLKEYNPFAKTCIAVDTVIGLLLIYAAATAGLPWVQTICASVATVSLIPLAFFGFILLYTRYCNNKEPIMIQLGPNLPNNIVLQRRPGVIAQQVG